MSLTRSLAISTSLAIVGCGSKSDPPPRPPPDAAMIDAAPTHDPAQERPDDIDNSPALTRPAKRVGRPVEIMLRSSPPGAQAYVDGVLVGTTPTFWQGETGAEHEFTFVAPKHAYQRYRFWPVQTGVLHARLNPMSGDVDVGVPPAHLDAPQPSLAPTPTMVMPTRVAPVAAEDASVLTPQLSPQIMPGLPGPADAALAVPN